MIPLRRIDRRYIHQVALKLNEFEEVEKKVPLDTLFSSKEGARSVSKAFLKRINSIPEDVFQRLCAEGKFDGDIKALYLVLTRQEEPKPYMLDPEKVNKPPKEKIPAETKKKGKPITRKEAIKVAQDTLVKAEKERKPRKKKESVEPKKRRRPVKKQVVEEAIKEPRKQKGEMAKDRYGFKVNTVAARILELVEKNRFTANDIAERLKISPANIYVVRKRLNDQKGLYQVIIEKRNGRKVLCVKEK